jgi:YHS domain-containing protein
MGDVTKLISRIDAEFSELERKIKHAQTEGLERHQERQRRLSEFERRLETLADIWRPRLEALISRFGDRAKVTPRLTASSREAEIDFQSDLARIRLRLSATTDHEVRKLILDYDLEIIPTLTQFEAHAQAEWPLDALDERLLGDWVDDRIVSFVKTYLSLHENEHYLKENMVADPIAGVRFPKFAAAGSVEVDGKTYHFINVETQREFEAAHDIAR